jgi:MOSC domain-containing protein YiiM
MLEISGSVRSVNIAPKKGRSKQPVASIQIRKNWGVEGDAHAGMLEDASHKGWAHRQVSLLAWESICKARDAGLDVKEGDFAENITTEGIDLLALPMGTKVGIGPDVELELSQVGKVCHTKGAIYHLMGDCVFPREGTFFVVRHGGQVKPGDAITIQEWGDGTCAATPKEALEELAVHQR